MELRKTVTTIFMVPTLGIGKNLLKNNGFLNGYIKDAGHEEQYEDAICLLFQPKNINQFREFLDSEYERTIRVIEDYDYKDGFVVVVYQLDPDFKADFTLIKEGKYSRTSKAFQNLFPRVVKIVKDGLHRDEISLQYRIFNRTEDLIDFWEEKFGVTFDSLQEVWSEFDEENETLNIEKIKEIADTY